MEWQTNNREFAEIGYDMNEELPADRGNIGRNRWQRVGRRLRFVLLAALLLLLLHVGLTNPTARYIGMVTVTTIKEMSTRIWRWGEGAVTSYGGPDLLLRQRAEGVHERLSQEVTQLAELETQAATSAEALERELRLLAQNQATTRTYLQKLADMIAQDQLVGPNGKALPAAMVETIIAERVAAYTAIQQQLRAAQEAQAAYRTAAIVARQLQVAVQQQLADLETYRALLAVTLPLVHEDTPEQPLSGQGLQALSEDLRLLLAQERGLHTAHKALAQAVAAVPLSAEAASNQAKGRNCMMCAASEASYTLLADLQRLTDHLTVGQLVR